MKKFRYEFEIDDDFEVGYCHKCLFNEWEWYDDGYSDCYQRCVLYSSSSECPLIEVEK